jgi:hypothetical protein
VKTAQTIEQQTERKKAEKGQTSRVSTPPVKPKLKQRDASRIAAWRWQPGKSANPGGRPKVDLSAEIARAVFEQDSQAIFQAFRKMLRKGSPYAYQVLSDRAYGKLKETIHAEISPYQEVSTPDLEAHVQELEAKMIASLVERGYTITKPPQLLPPEENDKKKLN